MFIDKFRFKILTSVPVRHLNTEPVGILSMGMFETVYQDIQACYVKKVRPYLFREQFTITSELIALQRCVISCHVFFLHICFRSIWAPIYDTVYVFPLTDIDKCQNSHWFHGNCLTTKLLLLSGMYRHVLRNSYFLDVFPQGLRFQLNNETNDTLNTACIVSNNS